MPQPKGSLLEKVVAIAVAALYLAIVAHVVAGGARRAAHELRNLRARKRPSTLALASTLRRLIR